MDYNSPLVYKMFMPLSGRNSPEHGLLELWQKDSNWQLTGLQHNSDPSDLVGASL